MRARTEVFIRVPDSTRRKMWRTSGRRSYEHDKNAKLAFYHLHSPDAVQKKPASCVPSKILFLKESSTGQFFTRSVMPQKHRFSLFFKTKQTRQIIQIAKERCVALRQFIQPIASNCDKRMSL